MPIARVQTKIQMDSLLPEDAVINTWHFLCTTSVAGETVSITSALNAFYAGLSSIYSGRVASPNGTHTFYDLSEGEPRQPVDTTTLSASLGANAGAYPSELAICMSFQSTPISGVNQARRRGRVFLGPLHSGVGGSGLAEDRPSAATLTAIRDAGEGLLQDSVAASGWSWVVYSPTTDSTGSGLSGYSIVDNGWVDDAYDVQRRRGVQPSTRQTF